MTEGKGRSFIRGAFFGAALGTILGILYAPDKGEVTRKKLKVKAEELEEKGKIVYGEAKVKAEEFKVKAEPIIEEAQEKLVDAIEKIKVEGEVLKEELEDLTNAAERNTKKLKKKYFKGTK